LSVNQRTISFGADDLSRLYGDANPVLTFDGMIGGDGLASFHSDLDAAGYGLTTTATATSDVGDYAIALTGTNGNYAMTFNAGALTVDPRSITITANDLSRIYGDANPALTYTVGGMGLVNSDTLGGALTTAAGAASDVGSYAITQGLLNAGANYAMTFNAGTLTVDPRSITITAADLSRIYGDANPALTYTVGGMRLVDGDTLSGALATAADSASDVGSYAIGLGTLEADTNYAVTFDAGTLTVDQRAITITANDLSRIYGDANPALSWTVGGMGLVDGDTLGGALTTAAGAASDVGSYAITQGLLNAGANYAMTFNPGTLTVDPRSITITADDLSRIYGDANPTLTAVLGGAGLASFHADLAMAGFGLSTDGTAQSNVGAYEIGLTGANANYAVTFDAGTLTVDQRSITVTANDLSRIYGEANPTLTYTVGGMGLVNSDALGGALTTAAGAASDVGSYAIGQGTLNAGANYAVTYVGGLLTITPRSITVTANASGKAYGETDPGFGWTVGGMGLVNGDALSGALTRAAGEDVGGYAIGLGTLTAGGNYTLAYTGNTFAITPRSIAVSANNLHKPLGTADPALAWTLSGGTLAAFDSLGAVFSGGLARAPGEMAGSYAIGQGTLMANANYDLAFVPGSLTIDAVAMTQSQVLERHALLDQLENDRKAIIDEKARKIDELKRQQEALLAKVRDQLKRLQEKSQEAQETAKRKAEEAYNANLQKQAAWLGEYQAYAATRGLAVDISACAGIPDAGCALLVHPDNRDIGLNISIAD
jgi:hypothetical protein